MHELRVNGSRGVLDCGLYQGHRKEARERNATLPFRAGQIDAAILSHAHIDHSGNLPTLVKNGVIQCDPMSEGFSSYKILSMSGARSAIGVTRDRTLLMVTCSCTVEQLAGVMKSLGACDAMNLDGGASSSLWVQGKYLVSPGRNISNALLVLKR
jgi:Cft2 family RNA processing exonuclease